MERLPNSLVRSLKAQAQRMNATIKLGKGGVTPAFIAALDDALKHKELVKLKFDEFKEEKKELAPQIAESTNSHLIMRVGNVAVYYRKREESPEAPLPEDGGE